MAAVIGFYAVMFLLGVCIGSFLNVCIFRMPKGESVVTVPSHCTSCGKRLQWYELIPLFSYIFLKGKCSGCKSNISPQYPLVEAACGLMFILVLYVKGLCIDMLLCQLLLCALLVIAVIDARTTEIPPRATLFIAALGTIRLAFNYSLWLDFLLGAVVLGGAFLLILLLSGGRAMGGGDVKLVAACGLFLGLKLGLLGFVLACVIGSVIHLIRMAFFGAGRQLAFGPYLAAGFAVSALWGQNLIDWYLGFF